MFAYCGNNPVCYSDPSGNIAIVDDILLALGVAIGITITAVITAATVPVIQEGWNDFTESFSGSSHAREDFIEQDRDVVIPRPSEKPQAYSTENPYDFNPKGLIQQEYMGTGNGNIIQWRDANSGKNIFEWDEDQRYGPHYHVMRIEWNNKHISEGEIHYLAGTPVPEPWNSWYFGGMP